ncbi:MAG: hypothetical protein R2750_10110 [Bacteroidales bacterium]
MQKVGLFKTDVGLMFVVYNIRQIMNILEKNELKKYLEKEVFISWNKNMQ